MMQKLWQEKLKLNYSKNVFDIVQFGSSVIEGENPRDLDIAVIFQKIPLKEQLEEAQKIKKQFVGASCTNEKQSCINMIAEKLLKELE